MQIEDLRPPERADEVLFSQLKAALHDALVSRSSVKLPCVPPEGSVNRISDLLITDVGEGCYSLTWHYRNLGDYDQDGVVAVEDIYPLAEHLGEAVPEGDTKRNSLQAVIDGSGDGRVGIEDVTPIARYFGAEVHDYLFEGALTPDGSFTGLWRVFLPASINGENERYQFEHVVTPGEYVAFRVVARDMWQERGEPSNTALVPGDEPNIIEVTPTNGFRYREQPFSAEVTGTEPLTYYWDFGGGAEPNTSTEASPVVTLGEEGEYSVNLIVTNYYGNDEHQFTLSVSRRETWVFTWGGSGEDYVNDITVDAEGNTYFCGSTNSFGASDFDVLLGKLDSEGNLQWVKTWGGGGKDSANAMALDGDGNLCLTGSTNGFTYYQYDLLLLKYDPEGHLLLERRWSGDGQHSGNGVVIGNDRYIYVAGYSADYGGGKYGFLLLRFAPDGSGFNHFGPWNAVIQSSDTASDLVLHENGHIYMTGQTRDGSEDCFLTKFGYNSPLWIKTWGGEEADGGNAITIDPSGNLYITGRTGSFSIGQRDVALLKYTPERELLWQRTWGGESSDIGADITVDSQGSIWVTGMMDYHHTLPLLQYDSEGNLLSEHVWRGSGYAFGSSIVSGQNSFIHIGGVAESAKGSWDAFTDGQVSTPSGIEDTAYGYYEGLPTCGLGSLAGVETEPVGVLDEGAGGSDAMVMRINPDTM